MTITPDCDDIYGDTLSVLLRHIELRARVYLRAEFCGKWALDGSGQHRAPFHLITRGSGWLHIEGQPPQQLTGGELVIFPRDTPHTISHSELPADPTEINQPPPDVLTGPVTGLMCGYFEFDQRAAELLLRHLPSAVVMDLRNSASHRDTAALIQLWINECATESPGVGFAIDQLAYVVFVHMLREQIASGRLQGPLGALSDPRLGPVLHQIHMNPGADHNVDRLADLAGMSRSSFSQHFKHKTGITPAQYVMHWRMQQATRLLRSAEDSITAIAEIVGYQSEVAFRKAYRSFTGKPPGKVRREGL
ncbi:MAG: AraC family transcriptional regulator [bacterium]|nr:AraC family transcriptional regulator [Gammaproteobacteria bacterium]